MGITIKTKTKAKATLKLANALRSYLFEEEYGDMITCTTADKKILHDALKVLNSIISKNK